MGKLKLGILLSGEIDAEFNLWQTACTEREDQVDFVVIDITSAHWLSAIKEQKFDGLLALPPNVTMRLKTLYDERLAILHRSLQLPVYPSLEEVLIYENKRFLSYWLTAHDIPHPSTMVFYDRKEALQYAETCSLPKVGKTNIGASGRGVRILHSREEVRQYVQRTFSKKGAPKSVGPNMHRKGLWRRAFKRLTRPRDLIHKLHEYQVVISERQSHLVILQDFVPHTFEWRCVRIGDSYFAHKKLMGGDKASGSLLKEYGAPPLALLDFVREITEERNLWSQAIDLFETAPGKYLVNEMQCIFGQSDPYQMLINGEAGRYYYRQGSWVFEAGNFNRHESFLLRLDHFIGILQPQYV